MNVFDEQWEPTPYPTPPGWEQRTTPLLPAGHVSGQRQSARALAHRATLDRHRRADTADYFDGEEAQA